MKLKEKTAMSRRESKARSNGRHRFIETDGFPFEFLSAIAEHESWRKEIHRPVYHVHKWWAKRLGSVFRGIILGSLINEGDNFRDAFFQKHDFSDFSIFDPFMGSGTTIGEAHKLGCAAIGQDINPVACESVRVALGPLDRHRLQSAFSRLEETIGERLRNLYVAKDGEGRACDVLYYFWVKNIPCTHCSAGVDLFSSRIIARNAYPRKKPEIKVCCPRCGDIFPAINNDSVHCRACGMTFHPEARQAERTKAFCPTCNRTFTILESVRALGHPPSHRLFAKLMITPEGEKKYLPANQDDLEAYHECSRILKRELAEGTIHLPDSELKDGHNTKQAISYNYLNWRNFFNDRQLLALGWLHEAIAQVPDVPSRDALLILFSGVLEFNNLFASYKGEGTGAVRHMFSHHILKPERMPIEANLWGTPKSSGSFSNLYKSRLLRALDYRISPFEVNPQSKQKIHFTSRPFSGEVETNWDKRTKLTPRGIYLSCASSDRVKLQDESIELVITDPPFFDNVHYSELADFFYSWQKIFPRGFINEASTTRHPHEVQDADQERFAVKLRAVWAECHRVLKPEGLLVFTYHHSRPEGWTALARSVLGSGFSIMNAHPVKAEMSVAAPKSQAGEPIQLDIILVCLKRVRDLRDQQSPEKALAKAQERAAAKLVRLASMGLKLSKNDRIITMVSQFIVELGPRPDAEEVVEALKNFQTRLVEASDQFADSIQTGKAVATDPESSKQMDLPLKFV
jgi:putative DNA methylase